MSSLFLIFISQVALININSQTVNIRSRSFERSTLLSSSVFFHPRVSARDKVISIAIQIEIFSLNLVRRMSI